MIDSPGVIPPSLKRLFSAAAVAMVLALGACAQEEPLGYASLGDSLAAGVGSSNPSEDSYSALYRETLEERTGREVEYRQLGLSGETARSFIGEYPEGDSQLVRAEEFLERHPGARVTLSLGGNDLLRVRGDPDRQKRAAISDYGEGLDFILETLEGASAPPAPRHGPHPLRPGARRSRRTLGRGHERGDPGYRRRTRSLGGRER